MQPIPVTITEIPGMAVQQLDFLKVISNVTTALVYFNARPGRTLPFDAPLLSRWRDTAVRAANTDGMTEILESLKMDSSVNKSPTRYLMQKYADVAAMLITDPSYLPDVGANLADELLNRSGGTWSRKFVSSPSLGYARPYLELNCAMDTGPQPIGLPSWNMDGIKLQPSADGLPAGEEARERATGGSRQPTIVMLGDQAGPNVPPTFRHALANMLQLIDRPLYSDRLVPEITSLGGRDPKEPLFGFKPAQEQVDRLTAIGLLYLRQADAFWTQVTDPLYNAFYDIAWSMNPRDRSVLEFKKKLREEVRRAIPLHPLAQSIANLFGNVMLSTRFGDKQLAFRHGATEERPAPVPASTAMLAGGSSQSATAQLVVADALNDYLRLRAISSSEDWARKFLASAAPRVDDATLRKLLNDEEPTSQTHGEVVEWIARNERYTKYWSESTRSIGWGGALGTPAIGIEASGADFVLCSGDFYSETPLAVLAGLRPSLPVSNKKITGAELQFSVNFNTGPEPTYKELARRDSTSTVAIKWSTLTAEGHMSALRGAVALTRFYMPPGMLMGEPDGATRFVNPGVKDETVRAIVDFYKSRSPKGYVDNWYGDPQQLISRVENEVLYMRTDWETQTENTDEDKTQSTLITNYGPRNISGEENGPDMFVFRQNWKMRVPVQMARTQSYELYNELGELRSVHKYEGTLVFDAENSTGTSVAEVDAFVNLLPISPLAMETIYTEEVKVPDTTV